MFKRLKVWMYLAVLLGGCLLSGGCGIGNGWLGLDNIPRIILSILHEDIFS